jgi:O-antigen/teichoic acid export membrane protein
LFSSFNYSPKVFREALSFGWPISLSAILYYFLSGVDRALLEPLNDTINFGLYNVAIQIVAYLYIFYTALSNTFEPDIYRSIAENNRKKLLKIVFGIILLNAIPIIVFILLAQPLVKILTFGRYTEAAEFARILAVKNIPMSLCFLVSNIIIGFGYPKVELINRFFGAVISVITFKLLISRYGFLGAAWGHTIAFVMMTLISLIFVGHKYLSSGVRYQSKD